jgi:prophage DNA circulation protein
MGWRDQLQRGRFRGVPFYCESSDQELGRRVVVHDYPLRPKPYPEDLGRKARTYNLTIFVLGDDYMPQRDRMIAALETEGPGTLVHPYRGELRVAVTAARVSESRDGGGMARFTVNFVESGEDIQPASSSDTADETELAADAADAATIADFGNDFSLDAAPEFVTDSALGQLNGVLDQLDALRLQMTPDLTVLTDAIAGVAKVRTTLLSLVMTPTNLANNILAAIEGVMLVADSAKNASFAVNSTIFRTSSAAPAPSTVILATDSTSRQRQKKNQEAINRFTQRAYLTQMVRQSARADYASRDEAIAQRNQVTDLVLAEVEGFDMTADTYQSFTRMQSAFNRHIMLASAQLARVKHVELKESEPALVTAYALYGGVTRVDELIDRNQVEHPAFMPAGTPLEVLIG